MACCVARRLKSRVNCAGPKGRRAGPGRPDAGQLTSELIFLDSWIHCLPVFPALRQAAEAQVVAEVLEACPRCAGRPFPVLFPCHRLRCLLRACLRPRLMCEKIAGTDCRGGRRAWGDLNTTVSRPFLSTNLFRSRRKSCNWAASEQQQVSPEPLSLESGHQKPEAGRDGHPGGFAHSRTSCR